MRTFIAIALTASWAASAAAGEPPRMQEYLVDETLLLGPGYDATAAVAAGPVEFTRVEVDGVPSRSELARHAGADDRDHTRVWPRVYARNRARTEVKLRLGVQLKDLDGRDYLRCERQVTLDAGEEDDFAICMREAVTYVLYTHDWPKVKALQLTAIVSVRPEEVAAPTGRREPVGGGEWVTLHYHRSDRDYAGWGLTAWQVLDDGAARTLSLAGWQVPMAPGGQDDFGVFWNVKASNFPRRALGYSIWRGTAKGQSGKKEQSWSLEGGLEGWVADDREGVFSSSEKALEPPRKQ